MLFSVYPQGGYPGGGYPPPPPPPKKSSMPVVLGVCGGCMVLAVIGMVVIGALGYKFGKSTVQKSVNATLFLAYVKKHRYADAEQRIAPQVRDTYSAARLEEEFGKLEQQDGPLQSWNSASMSQINSDNTASPFKMTFTLQYQKGSALLTFTFTGLTGPQANDALIQRLDLQNLGGKSNGFGDGGNSNNGGQSDGQ